MATQQEINESFVNKLVKGSQNVDHMRAAIGIIVSLILNSQSLRRRPMVDTGTVAPYGHWDIETTRCSIPCITFSVQDGDAWVTIYSSRECKLPKAVDVEGVYCSLPALLKCAAAVWPRLSWELQPFLNIGRYKFD